MKLSDVIKIVGDIEVEYDQISPLIPVLQDPKVKAVASLMEEVTKFLVANGSVLGVK